MKQQTSPFEPLYNLLIECCRDEINNEKLEEYASHITDWDGFLNSAYAHGIYPLITKSLKHISAVPDKIKLKLKLTNLDIAKRNMLMTTELLNIMKLLEKNEIKALAIKGPVLSQIIHSDFTIRQYADIDILIPKDEIYQAGVVLKNSGYTSEYSIEFLKNSTLLKVAKDFSIFNAAQNVHIEFHWQLFLERQVKKSKIDLFTAANPIYLINNQTIPTLEDDANLIYLLLHGSKHMWERIEWIIDIDRLIRLKKQDIDWEKLTIMAEDMEIEVMFYLGLSITNILFSTPLDQSILAKIKRIKQVSIAQSFILNDIMEKTILKENTKAIAFTNLYKMQLNKDNTRSVIKHYLNTLFQIKHLDVYMINLPNSLAFLYHVVRIYRMIQFYIFRSKSK